MKNLISKTISLTRSGTAINTYTLFAGNLIDSVFAFLFTVATFRLLTTADFGIFSAINNFIVLFFSLLDLGIGSAVINFVSFNEAHHKHQTAKAYFQTAIISRIAIALLFALPVIFLSKIIAPRIFLTQDFPAIIFAALAIVGLSIVDIFSFSLQAYQRFVAAAITASLYSLSRFALVLPVFIFGTNLTVFTAVAFTFIATLGGSCLGIYFQRKKLSNLKLDLEKSKKIFNFGRWIALNKVATSIAGKIDTQLLLLLAGPSLTGIYSVSGRMASFYSLIIASFAAVLAPKFAAGKTIKELGPFIKKASMAIAMIITGMLFGILISKPLLLFLWGEKSAESVVPFQALTIAYIPFVASSITISLIIYNLKQTHFIGKLSILQLLIIVSGNLFFIPRVGILGPALSLGITNLFVFIASNLYLVMKIRHADYQN